MVKEKIEIKWACPYCNQKYYSIEEAEDCARNCISIDEAIETEIITYECEICNFSYEYEREALQCEEDHEKKNDLKYNEYLKEEKIKFFSEIGNKIGQTKLK